MTTTIWKLVAIFCVILVLFYLGLLAKAVHLVGVIIVFIGGIITAVGNILV